MEAAAFIKCIDYICMDIQKSISYVHHCFILLSTFQRRNSGSFQEHYGGSSSSVNALASTPISWKNDQKIDQVMSSQLCREKFESIATESG